MYAYTNKCFTPDWTLIIAQKSTVVKIDVLCSDILADRLLGRTLYTVCNRARHIFAMYMKPVSNLSLWILLNANKCLPATSMLGVFSDNRGCLLLNLVHHPEVGLPL